MPCVSTAFLAEDNPPLTTDNVHRTRFLSHSLIDGGRYQQPSVKQFLGTRGLGSTAHRVQIEYLFDGRSIVQTMIVCTKVTT